MCNAYAMLGQGAQRGKRGAHTQRYIHNSWSVMGEGGKWQVLDTDPFKKYQKMK